MAAPGPSVPRAPYPPIEAYATYMLPAPGPGNHVIYVEESGNKAGKPVVLLHGGPGGGTNPMMRQYHDPACV